ncbi:UDP-N-acetylglucosamine 1-carboxyvinyltransferase [Acaryochloris sp. CCMEE 5410]|uniref:UDP-N-acetylglucosamine 1-carboxyvinyltransferase n=1 Tax=Acaryochloris sp. CCMEE 5410 TaxID=310037 RepID=UPI000493CDE3|nr:UDP-N-acetylglucosamine 1-carboxyvinyltransferase [Acaryochloris sp. CCMEE 5410]
MDQSVSTKANSSILEVWGGTPLQGKVNISGAKNSALVLMAGALLCSEPCRLRNVPSLADIQGMAKILKALGVKIKQDNDVLELDPTHITTTDAPYELVSKLRASFFAIGPLLARMGVAKVPLPGGCAIGARPVEIHVRGLKQLGAEVYIEHGVVHAYASKLKGAKIYLDYPSVGATETLMMAATLAEGETVLDNAAQEPEVADLANFCISMGAKITGAGTKTITISGVPKLHSTDYNIVPDRIEAGTFLMAGAITHSDILLSPVVPDHLTAVIAKLRSIGFQLTPDAQQGLRIQSKGVHTGTEIETLPYPGFPTDMQSIFMALLTLSEGNSVVTETVFENRLGHVPELVRMGADIRVKGNIAVIHGVPFLSGAPVTGTDLRATAALVVAALAAKGKTSIEGLQHLDRGYSDFEQKLRGLGAKIERVSAPNA